MSYDEHAVTGQNIEISATSLVESILRGILEPSELMLDRLYLRAFGVPRHISRPSLAERISEHHQGVNTVRRR